MNSKLKCFNSTDSLSSAQADLVYVYVIPCKCFMIVCLKVLSIIVLVRINTSKKKYGNMI